MASGRSNDGARRHSRHPLAVAMAASLGFMACVTALPAMAQEAVHSYALPAQPMGTALNQLAITSNRQIMVPPELVRGLTAPQLSGQHTLTQALGVLLANTGLSYHDHDGEVLIITEQDAPEPAAPAPAPSDTRDSATGGVASLDVVRVSGSRIDRADFVSPTPILPISAEEMNLEMRTNIGAALNDMPQFRATSSPQTTGSNTGAGNAPVDLRGLGISRTLVLLEGRRLSSDNDLNTIPSILAKYVDVVTGGASAAWGSGAVSGVVNISLDRELNGLKLGVQAGQSTYSDGKEKRFEAAWGTDFADGRGHFLIGGEFLDNDGIVPRSSRERAGRWSTMAIDGKPTLMPDVGFSDAAIGGLITGARDANGQAIANFGLRGQVFNSDGNLRPFQYGTVVGAVMSGGEGPSNDDFSPLSAPQKRYSALASVRYDLTDEVRMTTDIRHSRMYNNYIWFGDHNRGNLNIGIDNAFLPTAVRDEMLDAGATTLVMGRFNSDINYPHIDFERKTTQATLAFDGYTADDWRWTAYYTHGEAEQNFDTPGFILAAEWAQSIDSVIDPVTGNAVCRVALSNPGSLCVPINVFGEGAPSQAAVDYVTGTPSQRSKVTLDVFGASLRGEPFQMPAGAASVAVGIEARREAIDQRVGALDEAKAFRSFSFSPMAGSFTVKEMFGEVLLPIAKDRPVLNDLSVTAAARVSDYSTTGSIWSWKLGATNEFFDGFRGRIARSRDIRSANLAELYTTSTTGWSNVLDPFTNQTVYALSNGGGNPDLTPETADTLTFGVTWSPQAVEGLDLSLDYFDISIKDVIVTLPIGDILSRCFAGNPEMCARVERDASGQISRIVSTYTNLSEYNTDGIDFEVAYRRPITLFGIGGNLSARTLATWVNSVNTDDGVKQMEYVGSQGYAFTLGVPKWRAVSSLAFNSDVFSANVRARYISAGEYDRSVALVNGAIGSYVYYDIGASTRLGEGRHVELYAAVNNVTNKLAPIGSTFSPYYDVMGRYYTAGVRVSF